MTESLLQLISDQSLFILEQALDRLPRHTHTYIGNVPITTPGRFSSSYEILKLQPYLTPHNVPRWSIVLENGQHIYPTAITAAVALSLAEAVYNNLFTHEIQRDSSGHIR